MCVRGAERCARKLEEEYCIQRIRMVLNRVRPQLISHGKSGNIDDAMDEAGLPLLGLVPEDVDSFRAATAQEHSCRQAHWRGSRLYEYRPAAQRRAYSTEIVSNLKMNIQERGYS